MAAIDDYVNSTLAGLPNAGGGTYKGFDLNKLLQDRPDVGAEYQQEASRDGKSKANLASMGIYSDTDYAKWWLDNFGQAGGYSQAPAAVSPTAPVTPATPTTPTTPVGNPSGVSTTTSRDQALQNAIARSKLSVQSRGLDYGQYQGDIEGYLNNIFQTIPEGDANPTSYFDPSFTDEILNGKQAQARNTYTSQVNSAFGKNPLDYHALDDTINSILGDADKSAQDVLNAGLKRGQFNEVGVAAGQGKLATAKEKARAKLGTAAEDVFNTYDSKFDDIYNRALNSASGYQLGGSFDMSPFQDEYGRLVDSAKTTATGKLYDAIGDAPLINLQDIRGAVGQGQGAVNLTDLDVLDATAKRKQASGVGRGLGSQGAF